MSKLATSGQSVTRQLSVRAALVQQRKKRNSFNLAVET